MRFIIFVTFFLSCCTFVMGQVTKYTDTAYHIAVNKHPFIPPTVKSEASEVVIIQNSFPKGGSRYTDPAGKEFVYAFFWTRVSNETASPLELTIHFPADSLVMRAQADTYFKLFLPSHTMTFDKEPLFDYGFTGVKSFFDSSFNKPTRLQRTIDPKGECLFYVATLYNQGVDGVVRAALVLKGHDLFYSITDEEIPCGQIVFKN